MARRRVQREKQRVFLYWVVGALFLVAAVTGLLVSLYMHQAR